MRLFNGIVYRVLITVTLAMVCMTAVQAEEAKGDETGIVKEQDPRIALKADIQIAITMLEKGDFDAFLKRFPHPDQRATVDKAFEDPETMTAFVQTKSSELLQLMRAALNQDPVLTEKNNRATFEISKPGQKESETATLEFGRVDGRWYIYN